MKRDWFFAVVLGLCVFAAGCPGGEEEAPVAEGEAPAVTEQGGTSPTINRGGFKEGIGSGRAEDGSDEDK